MDALGHPRFAVADHDTGMWVGYARAADHPDRVGRLAVALAGLRPALDGKLSGGLDAQVRVPDPAGNAQKGTL